MKKYFPIVLTVLIAALVRCYDITTKNLWFDEIYSWKISQGSIRQIIIDTSGDIHPPFYYIVLKFWISMFNDSVFSMRMLSVIIAVIGMIYLFRLARMFTTNTFHLTMILLFFALSPLNIYYSQEVRMLNLNLALCLASVFYFYSFIRNSSARNAIFYSLFTLLSLYTHYFAFLILLTEIVIAAIHYFTSGKDLKFVKRYLTCFSVIILLYVPWLPVFIGQILKGQPWRKEQTFKEASEAVLTYIRETFFSSYSGLENISVDYLSAATAIFVLILLMYFVFRIVNQRKINFERDDSVILFFLLPLIAAWLISFEQSIVLSRYLSIILPYLFISLVLFSFRDFKKETATVIITYLILVSIYGTKIYFSNNFKNNDYRKIISYIEKNINENDKLIVEPHYMGWGIDYYLKHSRTSFSEPEIFGWNLGMQIDSLKKRDDFKNIWIVLDYSSLDKNGYDALDISMNEIGYKKIMSKAFYVMPNKVNVGYFRKE